MVTRWSVERKARTSEGDILQVIEIYAPGENKEAVKQENKQWSYRRELILIGRQ
ncbi:hypothetical protein [Bacillus sp. FSL K6-3431]|uniref:hypothetical protein n=1 Tax=Bacillus sp. FSL K6-3431 TaxID=2921500 RepID=UPI0030F88148